MGIVVVCKYIKSKTKTLYKCSDCGKSFSRKYSCKRHKENGCKYVKSEGPYECFSCGKTFTRKYSCKRHIRERCTKLRADRNLDVDRRKTIHRNEEQTNKNSENQWNQQSNDLSCVECGKSFRTLSWNLCCKTCSKEIIDDKQEHKILANDITEEENDLTCKDCGKNFSSKSSLQRPGQCGSCKYIKSKTLYKCSDCGKSFSRKYSCKRHKENGCKYVKSEGPYECFACGKTFTQEYSCKRHIRERCTKLRADKNSDVDRRKTIHRNEEETNKNSEKQWNRQSNDLSCVECGKSFRTLSWNLCCKTCSKEIMDDKQEHKILANDITEEENDLTCKDCGKNFSSKSSLRRPGHCGSCKYIKSKTLYKCSDCGKSFSRKYSCKRHKENSCKYVKSEGPYECFACGKTFTRKCSCKRHIRERCTKLRADRNLDVDRRKAIHKNEEQTRKIPREHGNHCERNQSNKREEIKKCNGTNSLPSSLKLLPKCTRLTNNIKCRNRLCKYCLKTFHSTSHLQRHLFYGACKRYQNELLKNSYQRNKKNFHKRYKYYAYLRNKCQISKIYFSKEPSLGTSASSVNQSKMKTSEWNQKKEQNKLHRIDMELECSNCMKTFSSSSWRLCCDECLDKMQFSIDEEKEVSLNCSFKYADKLEERQDVLNNNVSIAGIESRVNVLKTQEMGPSSTELEVIGTDMELECSNCMTMFSSSTWRLCCDKCLDEMQFSSKEDEIYAKKLEESKKVHTSDNHGTGKTADRVDVFVVNDTERGVNIMEAKMCSREEDECKRPRSVDQNKNEEFNQQNCTQIVSNVAETERTQDQISVPCKSRIVIYKEDLCRPKRREKKSYLCGKCGKIFRRAGYLRRHIRQVHSNERPYKCHICGKGFKIKHYLETFHMRTHSSERPCVCEICGKTFANEGSLRIHKTRHAEKKFKCAVCGKMTHTKSQLQRHLTAHTGERAFMCKVCKKAFKVEAALMRHMLIHTGDQPYQCKYCKRQFNQNCSLKRHERIHTGERPYHCPHCEKVFIQSASLTKHLVTHKSKKKI